MTEFSEEDRKRLMESIKKVEVTKRNVPPEFDRYVERRYLDWSIHNRGKETMMEFFKAIGEGTFTISSWLPKRPAMAAARELGMVMMRNKRTGQYGVFFKKPKKTKTLTFDPKMLMVDEDEKSEQTEEVKQE